MSDESRMLLTDCLEVLKAAREDEVVISVMGTAREWSKISDHPLDLIYVPSSMGQATALGLGVALSQPSRRVVVCQGDGSLLMNLGSLVTITAHAPKNLTVLLFDNGVYEVTGIQQTLAASDFRRDEQSICYASLARSCGFQVVHEFASVDDWQVGVKECLSEDGPVFVVIKTTPMTENLSPKSPGPAAERIRNFAAALQVED